MKGNNILKGSFFLAIGAFTAKLLGAVYRIPLTNLLGGVGLGLYQMVFPVYCVMLDFSGAGAPSALSKLISSTQDEKYQINLLKGSLRLLTLFGLVATLIMLIFSMPLAKAQGNIDAGYGYIFLAPAVLLVAVISCYRGYFQGKMNMTPTAVSQVVEQVVKLGFGLLFVYIYRTETVKAVAGATFAVTISELFALIYLIIKYKIHEKKRLLNYKFDKPLFKTQYKPLLKYISLVTLIGIALPLSHVLDSFLILNILDSYRNDATALYGLFSGTAMTVINLPVAICYGIATVAVPAVSGCKNTADKTKNAYKTLALTLAVAIPCALFCYFFSPFIVKILFSSLPISERQTTSRLIEYLSINVVLLSLLQTENAVLIGRGKLVLPLISMGLGIAIKTVLFIILLPMPNINIYAGVIGSIACYFTACLVNLILILNVERVKTKNACKKTVCG